MPPSARKASKPVPATPAGPRFEWKHLTGPAIDAFDRDRTVVIVSCSPLEVHGPHLPVAADLLEADALAERTMALLAERHPGIQFLQLPPLFVATDVVPAVGSIKFRTSTVRRALEDLGRSLARQGFRHLWVTSFHGGPRHYVAIETAADRVSRRYGISMVSVFSLLINQISGGRTDLSDVLGHLDGLSVEELRGDAHAGAIETALLLHLVGEHVAPGFEALEHRTVENTAEREGHPYREGTHRPSLTELLRGFKFKLKYFERFNYAGKPSIGSAAAGQAILEELAAISARAMSDVYTGKLAATDCHSPLWPIRAVFNSELLSWAFERAMRYRSKVW